MGRRSHLSPGYHNEDVWRVTNHLKGGQTHGHVKKHLLFWS
nr:putative integron gene cassette protein [uncultured bacterium]